MSKEGLVDLIPCDQEDNVVVCSNIYMLFKRQLYHLLEKTYKRVIWTGDCLTEIHLIEIVFFQVIESFNNELKHVLSFDQIF
jgi:hypothetical protein